MTAGQLGRTPDGPRSVPSRLLHDGPLPLYHQLEQDLTQRISDGEFGPGEPLPTEERICEQYGVSRITVRRALESLFGHGLIVRRRGVGSFVAERREGVRSVRLSGSLDEFLATAGMLEMEVLALGPVDPPAEAREALELAEGEQAVRLEVVSGLSAGPVIYLEVYFPLAIGSVLTRADIVAGSPVVRIIERKLSLRVVHAQQLVEPALAGEPTATHLGLAPDAPILRIRRTYFAAGDRPIEVAILRYHPERYQYMIDFRTRPAGL